MRRPEPELRFYTLEGRHHLTIRIELPLEPVTAQDRAAFEAPLRSRLETVEGTEKEMYRQRLDGLEYPACKGYWGTHLLIPIEFDSAGFIWIRIPAVNKHGTPYEEGFTWMLLSPDGEFMGRTRRPPGATHIGQTLVGALCEDPDSGEQHLSVYRPVPLIEDLIWP